MGFPTSEPRSTRWKLIVKQSSEQQYAECSNTSLNVQVRPHLATINRLTSARAGIPTNGRATLQHKGPCTKRGLVFSVFWATYQQPWSSERKTPDASVSFSPKFINDPWFTQRGCRNTGLLISVCSLCPVFFLLPLSVCRVCQNCRRIAQLADRTRKNKEKEF